MKRSVISILVVAAALASCKEKIVDERPVKPDNSGEDGLVTAKYQNPVIRNNCPDPSVFDDRQRTGYFYAYSTQNGESGEDDCIYLPVYRSSDMVNWEYLGNAFGGSERPQWVSDTRVWAPDMEYIDGRYCLYYALGHWDNPKKSACGVAVSDSPAGPFTWTNLKSINPSADANGMLVDYASQGVSNSIDPNIIREATNGDLYLFWGSFGTDSGVWAIQLTPDGLAIAPGAQKTYIAYQTEGTYVHYRNGYYYLFGSKGSCCEKNKSTYHVVVGRSADLLGPYAGPDGKLLSTKSNAFDNDANTILRAPSSGFFAGTGHVSEIITDDKGKDWICYHNYWSGNKYDGRCLSMDEIIWENGWPATRTGFPSEGRVNGPAFKKKSVTAAHAVPYQKHSLSGGTPGDAFSATRPLVETSDSCGCRNTWRLSDEYVEQFKVKSIYE